MNRSWISTGRHPSGLCGAAIMIAAKVHQERRSRDEIIKIVHVSSETVRKRVNEFKTTKTAQLTRAEFETKELEQPNPYNFDYEEDYEPPEKIMKQIEKQGNDQERQQMRELMN